MLLVLNACEKKVNRAIRDCMGVLHSEMDVHIAASKRAEAHAARLQRDNEDAIAAARLQTQVINSIICQISRSYEQRQVKSS